MAPAPDPRAELAGEGDMAGIGALFDEALPDSLAGPGLFHPARWRVVRTGTSSRRLRRLVHGVGFLGGVASAPSARHRGLARAVVRTGLHAIVEDDAVAALMVDGDNVPARRLYDSFGRSYRALRAARHAAAEPHARPARPARRRCGPRARGT